MLFSIGKHALQQGGGQSRTPAMKDVHNLLTVD